MEKITKVIFQDLYRPPFNSHKGQNGKLTIIGGSKLFHGASLWSLKIASRIVDMVFYAPVAENRELTNKLKSELYDFICVPREEVEDYIEESDAVLIGPGLMREEYTRDLTKRLLTKFPQKKWVLDAGSLQMMNPVWLKKLKNAIITPHKVEYEKLFSVSLFHCSIVNNLAMKQLNNVVFNKAKEYGCTIVLKGSTDIVCSPTQCVYDSQGNPGMTKGGTGDVLAGLIAALACKNDLFLSGCAGVFAQGLAGDRLYERVGPYFNASDLCDEIPKTLKELMVYQKTDLK